MNDDAYEAVCVHDVPERKANIKKKSEEDRVKMTIVAKAKKKKRSVILRCKRSACVEPIWSSCHFFFFLLFLTTPAFQQFSTTLG